MVAVSQDAGALESRAGAGAEGWLPPLRHTWRVAVPTSFVSLAFGFSLLPGLHPNLQIPTVLAGALLIGVGAEFTASAPGHRFGPPGYAGLLWVIPSGAVLAVGFWLLAGQRAGWFIAPALALAISALLCIQGIEAMAPNPLRGAAHTVMIGCGFALGLPAYAVAAAAPPGLALAITSLVTAALALVVLRRPNAPLRSVVGYTGLTALIVGEIGAVLREAPLSPAVCAGFTLLALYAVSAVCHALLDRAGPRTYVEVAVVMISVLLGAGLLVSRA